MNAVNPTSSTKIAYHSALDALFRDAEVEFGLAARPSRAQTPSRLCYTVAHVRPYERPLP